MCRPSKVRNHPIPGSPVEEKMYSFLGSKSEGKDRLRIRKALWRGRRLRGPIEDKNEKGIETDIHYTGEDCHVKTERRFSCGDHE